jgi:hypothetical protein
MGDEEHAETVAHLPALDQRLHTLGEVDDLLETSGADPEHLCHTASTLSHAFVRATERDSSIS